MEEDRQPNERRLQRKGDHRVPRVRSSAVQKYSHTKKSRHKKPPGKKTTPRVHNTGSVGTLDDAFGERGSSGVRSLPPPPLRDFGSAQGESPADRRPTTTSVSVHDVC